MKTRDIWILLVCFGLAGCGGEKAQEAGKLAQYRAEQRAKDSTALADQQRTIDFYQEQYRALMPVMDSLIQLFQYEPKDPKYQDHGYYVLTGKTGMRILVRDDGKDLLLYKNGKRVDLNRYQLQYDDTDYPLYERALHLKITMNDMQELENRINFTSLEIQKYERRLSL